MCATLDSVIKSDQVYSRTEDFAWVNPVFRPARDTTRRRCYMETITFLVALLVTLSLLAVLIQQIKR